MQLQTATPNAAEAIAVITVGSVQIFFGACEETLLKGVGTMEVVGSCEERFMGAVKRGGNPVENPDSMMGVELVL